MPGLDYEVLLEAAVAEVLESMCFLSVNPDISSEEESRTIWVNRRVDFRGPTQGSFGVAVKLPTAILIAGNFLGQEPEELTELQACEVVGEIANMVCGTLLAQVDPQAPFHLATPRAEEQSIALPNRITRSFVLDEGALFAWLELN